MNYHLFKIISIICLLYFGYNTYHYSIQTSFLKTLVLWATVVVATPIPSAALLLSFPAKVFFNISMYISQIVASILSIGILYLYSQYAQFFVQSILQNQLYSIFVICILCSVILSKMLDSIIDYKKLDIETFILLGIVSSILLFAYKVQIDRLEILK
jgi:hypothetical protein